MSAKEAKVPKTFKEKESSSRLIVILEGCHLETVKVGNNYELLNCDDHQNFLKKMKRDTADARPDITHQCLLSLLDSPLNKAGKLQVYLHTANNVLIEINPATRIPRTFKRFAGLMVQLLHKLSIRSVDGPEKLLKVIKNPITDHLPTGCPKYGTSYKDSKLVNIREFAGTVPEGPVVFVIGGIAKGQIHIDYTDELLSFSDYPLSASVACGKLCNAFEETWNIL
eukprot:GCRY01005715.1.p1 GENE.GCRY01005715.1~~GCRY01005715.1.p1  ORF type:complete len:234 (-),score=54.39 GCRY01005715.1:128-802(-)